MFYQKKKEKKKEMSVAFSIVSGIKIVEKLQSTVIFLRQLLLKKVQSTDAFKTYSERDFKQRALFSNKN